MCRWRDRGFWSGYSLSIQDEAQLTSKSPIVKRVAASESCGGISGLIFFTTMSVSLVMYSVIGCKHCQIRKNKRKSEEFSLGERKTQLVTRIDQKRDGRKLSLITQQMVQRKLKSRLNRKCYQLIWARICTYIVIIVNHLLGGGGCFIATNRSLVDVQVHLQALEAAHEEHDGHGQDASQDHG